MYYNKIGHIGYMRHHAFIPVALRYIPRHMTVHVLLPANVAGSVGGRRQSPARSWMPLSPRSKVACPRQPCAATSA